MEKFEAISLILIHHGLNLKSVYQIFTTFLIVRGFNVDFENKVHRYFMVFKLGVLLCYSLGYYRTEFQFYH